MRRERGFTLLEVMVSLAILAAALVVIVQHAASNLATTQNNRLLGTAIDLTRLKMGDIEEQLLDPLSGFQAMTQESDGDFGDQEHAEYKWKAKVEKIEIPGMPALEALMGGGGEEGAEGGVPGADLLKQFGGGGGDDPSSPNAAGGMSAQAGLMFPIIKQILEESIRKVTLTVTWDAVGGPDELLVTCFFTDPAAINRVIGGLPPPEGDK